ncbi:MAG TPA: outer membrane beta-barrel protein [Polyangium sp.]|nr:outer membrane beta-barrel protein [Polyangium sp.]
MRRLTILLALAVPFMAGRSAFAADDAAAAPIDDAAMGDDDPARAAPAGKGVVWGVVTDAKSNEPVIDAQVSVVGTNKKAIADFDGRYRLELAPGVYELRVFYQLYKAQRVQNVRVVAGKVEKLDVGLSTEENKQEIVVEIETEPDRATATAQTLIRKNAAAAGDAISAQEIARTPDRNAADAARRVVGVSVVNNRYVFVRGLGERYTNALINGAPLPSPEPDRQAVPFDMFPTTVLSDITVVKTFTPDMPGDFTGGSVRIHTRELPEKFTVSGTLSLGVNTVATFRDRLTYRGSSTDWLGIDDGTRALPSTIPNYRITRLGPKPDGSVITRDELTRYGQQLNAYMSTQRTLTLPNMSGNFTVGDTLKRGENHELGYIAALTYGRRYQVRTDEVIRRFTTDRNVANPVLNQENDYRNEAGIDLVTWGGYGGLTYRYAKDHKISLIGLHTRSSENEAREIQGFNKEAAATIYDTRLRFTSRALTFGQLTGEHKFRNLQDASMDWTLTMSSGSSTDPDMRENVYQSAEGGRKVWDDGTQSGLHFFGQQTETIYGGLVNWTQPLTHGDNPTRVKFGALALVRSRDFEVRRFRFLSRNQPGFDYAQSPDELFVPQNIGTALELDEWTRTSDSYVAEQQLLAGYAMTDTAPTRWMRIILGARLEASTQTLESFDRFDPTIRSKSTLATVDILPSANVVFKTTPNANLRLSATRTIARPQLRELAPFLFTEYFGARDIYGNPNLDRTSIMNLDARYEWFPTLSEVVALSVFYKQFRKPIEKVILPAGNNGTDTFMNAEGAQNAGVEVEARKNLRFMHERLANWGAMANLTLVYSRVTLGESQSGLQTNNERPLAGQSPFVINMGADYANDSTGTRFRLLYNVFGRRITQVGGYGLADVYEQPRHVVDVTIAQRIGKSVDLKLAAENLLFAPEKYTQGPDAAADGSNVVGQFQPGATFTLSATLQN